MAVYDLQEQEQIETLKAWWQQNHKLLLLVVAVTVVTASSVVGWRYYQNKQALAAGDLYSQLQAALDASDKTRAQAIAATLVENYPRTGYAALAALVGASISYDAGDAAAAKTQLQWLTDHAADDATRDLARARLAALLLGEKQYPDALTLLEVKHGAAWDSLYADLRGDVLVAQGRMDEARAAYQTALDKSAAQNAYRAQVQIKLDALGGTK